MKFRQKIVEGIATAGFIGHVPIAPGTFGSILGCLIYFGVSFFSLKAILLGLIVFIVFAMWIANMAEKILNTKDPGCIVIDEIAGMMVTLLAIPMTFYAVVAGFLIFRFFDILKPFPIRWLERKCPGGIGVVIDDVAAGVMSNIVLHILLWMVNFK